MAQVTIRINGYAYTVGCADGQESHLESMAGEVDQRIDKIKAAMGQSGESRLLVLAALMMADELHDLKAEFATMKAEFVTMQKQLARAESASGGEGKLGRRLGKLAQRAEEIAAGLEHP
jgi:cell division protein ZapA